MHEIGICQDIIARASQEAGVKKIYVEVGELAHIPMKELKPTIDEMSPWPVELREKESVVSCDCGFSGRPKVLEKGHDNTVWSCPECDAMMPKVKEGDQIILTKVDV